MVDKKGRGKMQDTRYETIDVTEWLKSMYGKELNPYIYSVSINQNETDVWVKIEWRIHTPIGVLEEYEIVNLKIVVLGEEPPEEGELYGKEITFSSKDSLYDNAKLFFEDKITLYNVTPLFDDELFDFSKRGSLGFEEGQL